MKLAFGKKENKRTNGKHNQIQKKPEKNMQNGPFAYLQVEPSCPPAQYLLWYITGELLWSFGDSNKSVRDFRSIQNNDSLSQFLSAETLLFPS